MTVLTSKNRKDHILSASVPDYDFDFRIFSGTNLVVKSRSLNTGVETSLVLNTDYTVTGAGNQNGGHITVSSSFRNAHNGEALAILRILPIVQNTSIRNQGKFFPETHEDAFDYMTMVDQQLSETLTRTLTMPESIGANIGMPSPQATTLLGWNSTADALKNYSPSELVSVVAYGTWRYETFYGDGTKTEFPLAGSPGVLANMDVSISGTTQIPGVDYSLVNGVLVFTVAPPDGTTVLIRYGDVLPTGINYALQTAQVTATATAGQTVFNISPPYPVGTNALAVYCNGLRLTLATDFVETNSTTVTLNAGRAAGDEMLFVVGREVAAPSTPSTITVTASDVTFAPSGDITSSNTQDAVVEVYTKTMEAIADIPSSGGTGTVPFIVVTDTAYGAKGDGVSDDTTAIQAALDAAQGNTVYFPKGTYKVSLPIRLRKQGTRIVGAGGSGGGTFSGTTGGGAILKWAGAAGGTVLAVEPNGSSYDLHGVGVDNIQIDGGGIAGYLLSVHNVDHSSFKNLTLFGTVSGSSYAAVSLGTLSHAFATLNCCYGNVFENIAAIVTGSTVGFALDGSGYGGENTCFCTFNNIHVTHSSGPAFYLRSCDDNTFTNIRASRLAGGTGYTVQFDGTSADTRWVVGNTFYGVQCGTADSSHAGIYSAGTKARQNKIYGLSGVDDSPTVTINSGSQLWYDYIGTGYSSTDASENAHIRTQPLKFSNFPVSDSTTLDWYEEGTFVPSLLFGGGNTGMTYTGACRYGKYTRIGNTVHFSIDIHLASKGSSTGAATVSGIPYVATWQNNTPLATYFDAMTSGGYVDNPVAYIAGSSNTIYLTTFSPATGVIGYMADTHFTATSRITITGTYLMD